MKKVLLVIPPSGVPDETIRFAVNRAKKDSAGLIALYLLGEEQVKEVFDTFTDVGFIGDKPSTQLSETMMKEFRQRGYEELGRVQIKAMEEGVDFEPLMERGESADKVLSVIGRNDVSAAVLTGVRRRAFFKYFKRSLADEVAEAAPCEVIILSGDREKEER